MAQRPGRPTMPSTVCPSCGRPLRSAAGCSCGGGAGTTWELPALEVAIERRVRLFAIPVALVLAWAAVHAGFLRMLVRTVLSMWIHELGHAVAAWLCGRFAVPGPWFTPMGSGRSLIVVLLVAAALVAGAVRLWGQSRPWSVALLALLPVQLYCSFGLGERQATAFIIWSGDGGCLVLGTLLMLSLYARKQSQIRVGWLRWGFLVIGAAAWADGFATWWAARTDRDAIPFGENEGRGLSDPTVLVFEKGFSIPGLVSSYIWAGALCLAVLAVAYVLGLRKLRERERS
jgi:hypothetical protein